MSVPSRLRQRTPTRLPRSGLSILEVMIAAVMMAAGVAAFSQMAFIARRHALKAEDLAIAQQLCHAKLAELQLGVEPVEDVQDEPFPDAPDWTFTVETQTTEDGLLAVRVTVARAENDGPANGAPPPLASQVRVVLTTWMMGQPESEGRGGDGFSL